MTPKELDECCRPLVGAELVSVELLDYSWFLRFGVDIVVATEALWLADKRDWFDETIQQIAEKL